MKFALILLSAGFCMAQNSLTPAEKKAGWKLLFDGKTMKGWADPSKLSPAGDSWTIEDGCLKARPKPLYREDLVSLGKFSDFELQFEWKISSGGNSGLKYRIQEFVPLSSDIIKKSKKFEDSNMFDAVKHFIDENVTFIMAGDPAVIPFSGTYHGREGFKELHRRFFSVLEIPAGYDHLPYYSYISNGTDVLV